VGKPEGALSPQLTTIFSVFSLRLCVKVGAFSIFSQKIGGVMADRNIASPFARRADLAQRKALNVDAVARLEHDIPGRCNTTRSRPFHHVETLLRGQS
jgi:hypothetical protein